MEWISVSTAKYDTFISYSREDKLAADILAGRLRAAGLTVWLDRDSLVVGNPFPAQIEKGLEESASCCILVGRGGLTRWQEMERQVAALLSVNSGHTYRVIAVILPNVGPETRVKLPKFLAATTWVEFAGSMEDEETLHQLVCGIRGIAPGPPPFDPVPSAGTRPPPGAVAHDLSWAHSALPAAAAVRFLFGTLQSLPTNRPELCHYLVALIEKYSVSNAPAVAPAELRYVAEARQVLAQNGWPNAAPVEPAVVPKDILNVLVNAGGELPESLPTPDYWVGTSLPTTQKEGTRFHLCDVNLALVCILLHCADESRRPDELRGDLLYLPGDLRDEVRMLVGWLWPEVLAPSYEYMELPRVRDAFRTALKIMFPAGRGARATFQPTTSHALAQALEALRRRDFLTVRKIRKDLGEGAASDASPLAYIDASLAIAEGDDATAELVLCETLKRSADTESGCNLALLLCWQGRYQEAGDVLRRLESAVPSAVDSPLFKTLNLWASYRDAPQSAVEDMAATLTQSGQSTARLWHILSAACLDMGLVDAAIEYAKKATRQAPKALEYRVQHAAALLHRFPSTPPDYQRRAPFPVRDREPREASYILESVLDGCAQQDERFVQTVHHLLGIAHYCAAVANPKQSERLKLFFRAAEQFSAARESGGMDSYRLAGYAGQSGQGRPSTSP
jgi:tetratricopeptide (TPR) repeat protein